MECKDRFTQRISMEDGTLFYVGNDSTTCMYQLGLYEDFGLTPQELAIELTQYEMQKAQKDWDLDKLKLWQQIIKNCSNVYHHKKGRE